MHSYLLKDWHETGMVHKTGASGSQKQLHIGFHLRRLEQGGVSGTQTCGRTHCPIFRDLDCFHFPPPLVTRKQASFGGWGFWSGRSVVGPKGITMRSRVSTLQMLFLRVLFFRVIFQNLLLISSVLGGWGVN